jgi:hypothetical protein
MVDWGKFVPVAGPRRHGRCLACTVVLSESFQRHAAPGPCDSCPSSAVAVHPQPSRSEPVAKAKGSSVLEVGLSPTEVVIEQWHCADDTLLVPV